MEEGDFLRRKAFSQIKESCVVLSRLSMVETSRFNERSTDLVAALQQLNYTLINTDSPSLVFNPAFGDYIFLPLSHILQHKSVKPLSDRVTELLLNIIAFLTTHCWNVQLKRSMAKEFLILIVSLVSVKDKQVSNETKYAACLALNALFKTTYESPEARELYVDLKKFPVVNFTVIFLLEHCFLDDSGELDLQLLALETLTRLFFDLINNGEVLAVMLPGAMSAMSKSLSGVSIYGKKRHFKCISASINFLRDLLVHVFDDDALGSIPDQVNSNQTRTASWLKFTKEQVKISLNQISKLRNTNRQECLLSLLAFSEDLLAKTSNSLDNCMFLVIDTLALLASNTDYLQVSEGAKGVISDVLSSENDKMKDLILQRVDSWIDSLPRLLIANDDENTTRLLESIKIMLGLFLTNNQDISVLQDRLVRIVCDSVTLVPRATNMTLGSTSKSETGIQISDSQLRQMATMENTVSTSSDVIASFASLSLTNYVTPRTQKSVESLFEFLGTHISSTASLLELFLSESISSPSDSSRLVSTWLGLSVLKGFISKQRVVTDDWFDFGGDDDHDAIILQSQDDTLILSGIVHELGDFYYRTLEGSMADQSSEAMICFALRGMGLLSQLLEQSFKNELVDYLYPIINHISGSSQVIAKNAHDSIITIASNCGYTSVRELIFDNMDYIIDTVSIKLQTLDITLQAPLILTSLIKLSGPSITVYFDDLVASMFVILDDYHGYSRLTESIFKVFKALVQETNTGNENKLLKSSSEDTTEGTSRSITDIEGLIQQLSREATKIDIESENFGSHPNAPFSSFDDDADKEISDDELLEEGEDGKPVTLDNEEEQDIAQWTSPVAKSSYMVIRRITDYTTNFLTHESSSLRYNLLSLIGSAVPILATQKTEFLPIINRLWPSVVRCLSDPEEHIVVSAIEIIELFCINADGSFMLGRIEDVWPLIKIFLPFGGPKPGYSSQSSVVSPAALRSTDSGILKRAVSSPRITSAIYSALGEAIKQINLPMTIVEDIITTNAPLICSGGELRPKATALRQSIDHKYGDMLWLYDCINQQSLQTMKTPIGNLSGSTFAPIYLG